MSKIIAMYLPQYHVIPENDQWWGKGYTDWVAVKAAKPMFKGHVQPKIPYQHHYYDLSNEQDIRRQAALAEEYGIYGFGIYHYWFSSSCQLLQTPSELILKNKDIPIHFMFTWDNSSWIRTWSNVKAGNAWVQTPEGKPSLPSGDADSGVLAELQYGNKIDWGKHYHYLQPFFDDKRYIKVDNRPMFAICKVFNNTLVLKEMLEYWNELAKRDGFDGIHFVSLANVKRTRLEYMYRYEPGNASRISSWMIRELKRHTARKNGTTNFYKYDSVWKKILFDAKFVRDRKCYFGALVNYDDTPRRGKQAMVVQGGTPKKFQKYMTELLNIAKKRNSEFIFLTAWNEWGEGAYLEPDEEHGFAYLEALRSAIQTVNSEKSK